MTDGRRQSRVDHGDLVPDRVVVRVGVQLVGGCVRVGAAVRSDEDAARITRNEPKLADRSRYAELVLRTVGGPVRAAGAGRSHPGLSRVDLGPGDHGARGGHDLQPFAGATAPDRRDEVGRRGRESPSAERTQMLRARIAAIGRCRGREMECGGLSWDVRCACDAATPHPERTSTAAGMPSAARVGIIECASVNLVE